MKTSKATPSWALELVTRVCKDYNRALPGELKWMVSAQPGFHSSGRTSYARHDDGRKVLRRTKTGRYIVFRGKLLIGAGSDEADQRLVLLHELAHWVVVRGKAMGHTTRFWKKAFELYSKYGVDMEYAFDREKSYKKTAVTVYERYYRKES